MIVVTTERFIYKNLILTGMDLEKRVNQEASRVSYPGLGHRITRYLLVGFMAIQAACTAIAGPTEAPLPTKEPTAATSTYTPRPSETPTPTSSPTHTPRPTHTPAPTEVPLDLDSFYFPLDVNEIKLEQPYGSTPIEYKIATRPVDDPCGSHAGDGVSPAGLPQSAPVAPNILVYSPYDATISNMYPAGGGGLTVVLKLGKDESGVSYFLDIAHVDKFYFDVGDEISEGQLIAEMDTWRIHGGYYEMQLHLGMAKDFSNFDHPENYQTLADILLPKLLTESSKHTEPVLFTYEGPNFCNMISYEKINALLHYLETAGFTVTGNNIVSDNKLGDLSFSWYQWDNRSILISPN